jgi:N-acetylmuramoyl-L-alanine amidase
MAKELAEALNKQGAKTLFSRDCDIERGLAERARMAINQDADFFIALHCNSNLVPNTATGIETYYHRDEPSPKTLAYMIHQGAIKYTGMRDRGALSDRVLPYTTGLGVLRTLTGSGVPGILLECGYINNSSDRARLLSEAYRSKLIGGVVAGLKAYVEGATVQ